MKDKDVLLEEYRSLRGEIVQTIRLRTEVFFLSIAAFAGLCFWTVTNRCNLYTELSLLLLLLIPYFSYHLLIVLNTKIVTISSYIITVIESANEDLNWETMVNSLYEQRGKRGWSERHLYQIVYIVLGFLSLALVYSYRTEMKKLFPSYDLVVIFVGYLLLILLTWKDRDDRRSLSVKWQQLMDQ